jgi:catechol 2,3-dioxygenase-like lactoylglutathione lyase family enzyme
MKISRVIAQLQTADLDASIRFYTESLGMNLAFKYENFYAGIEHDGHLFHLKHVDAPDPSVAEVRKSGHFHLYFEADDVAKLAETLREKSVPLVKDLHETLWHTREFVIEDDQGHTLYFGAPV